MTRTAVGHRSSAAVGVLLAVSLLCGTSFARQARPASPDAKAAQDTKAPGGDVQRGKKLYASSGCYECHGTVAHGSPRTGPMLLTPLPFAAFIKQLRQPTSEMPPYEAKVLSDQQVADIYAFIQTLPRPVDHKTIKLLQ